MSANTPAPMAMLRIVLSSAATMGPGFEGEGAAGGEGDEGDEGDGLKPGSGIGS